MVERTGRQRLLIGDEKPLGTHAEASGVPRTTSELPSGGSSPVIYTNGSFTQTARCSTFRSRSWSDRHLGFPES